MSLRSILAAEGLSFSAAEKPFGVQFSGRGEDYKTRVVSKHETEDEAKKAMAVLKAKLTSSDKAHGAAYKVVKLKEAAALPVPLPRLPEFILDVSRFLRAQGKSYIPHAQSVKTNGHKIVQYYWDDLAARSEQLGWGGNIPLSEYAGGVSDAANAFITQASNGRIPGVDTLPYAPQTRWQDASSFFGRTAAEPSVQRVLEAAALSLSKGDYIEVAERTPVTPESMHGYPPPVQLKQPSVFQFDSYSDWPSPGLLRARRMTWNGIRGNTPTMGKWFKIPPDARITKLEKLDDRQVLYNA